MKKTLGTLLLLVLFANWTIAQKAAADSSASILDKKFYWGFTFVNAWSKVKGDFEPYFAKPTLGGGIRAEYYLNERLGISAGLSYQQRGSGIKTPDFDKSLGNADSTHRLRLRFNSIEMPLSVVYRGKNTLFGGEGVKFTAGAGITPLYNFHTKRFFASIEDGFHLREDYTEQYYSLSACTEANAGLLISAGEGSVLQVNALISWGLGNVHRNNSAAPSEKSRMAGIRLGFMF